MKSAISKIVIAVTAITTVTLAVVRLRAPSEPRRAIRAMLGTVYYFSTSGSDGNSGTSSGSPWQTITKFNSFAFLPDDSIVFNRGDVWTGTAMQINRSGTSGHPIKIGAYGSGADPVISGMYTISSGAWTSLGGNLWKASVPAALPTARVVTYDGNFQAMGKLPKGNNAYYNITSGTATTITSTNTTTNNSNTFPSGTSFTGGQIVWRAYHWSVWVATISSGAGSTVTFTALPSTGGGGEENPVANYGFFIQNHPNACTLPGEWAYNGTTHELTVNFGAGGPSGHTVKVSAIDNLVSAASKSFVNISNIYFEGGNTNVINLTSSTDFSLNSVTVFGGGVYGFFGNGASSNFSSVNCSYLWNNSCAMRAAGTAVNWTLTSNLFNHNGSIVGMGGVGEGEYFTVRDVKNATVRLNTFKNSGYIPLSFQQTGNLIQNNFIDTFGFVKDDGGGIYCGGANDFGGSRIDGNVILHGLGAKWGTPDPDGRVNGTYVDDGGFNVIITNNTIAFCSGDGINFHNAHEITCRGNTSFDNGMSQVRHYNDKDLAANITFASNICFALSGSELVYRSSGGTKSPTTFFGPLDSNKYCRPINESSDFQTLVPNGTYNLAAWKTFIGKDAHSVATPWTIVSTSEIRFEYNATNASVGVSLGATNYIDLSGANHTGTLTLPAWSSIILKTNGAGNALPVVNAGPDQVKTLPTNSATMAGSATDPDGSIASYHWDKISGPATFTITNAASATTTITGLVQGVYQFQLTATDNVGGVNTDVMQVTVNAAGNILPVANAGIDKAITLPVNTVNVTGSGSDADGTIVAYQWTQVGSTPSIAAIVSPSQAATTINNLGTSGTYQFQLRVTDNSGANAFDIMQVVVSPPANSPPLANAGIDQTITGTSTSVTGTSSDPGGSIAGVAWSTVSVPIGNGTLTYGTPTANTTTVGNMTTVGAYTLRYTATDNLGATSFDDIVIQKNGPANVPPTSNAGGDQSITLPANSVNVSGSGSSDPDGSIVGYLWTKISGPTSFNIVSASQVGTTINNLVQGVYQFNLRVTDNNGATGNDQVQITVNAAANPPPLVSAGPNITITKPTNSTSVTGTASDPGGSIAGVQWTVVGKPTGAADPTLGSATSLTTTVGALDSTGTYTLRLTATDNLGATAFSQMTIQVNGAPNILPVSNAGADQFDTLGQLIFLDGISSTDADGSIVGYQWLQLSGPVPSLIVSASQRRTEIRNVTAGIFRYQLRVTDNNGGIDLDTVQVSVYDSIDANPNDPPIANAGPNFKVYLCWYCGNNASVNVVGSGIQGTVPITTYEWTKISGPVQYTIVNPDSAATAITGMVRGQYVFQLKVIDGKGLFSTDTIYITISRNWLQFNRKVIIVSYP